jgi:hypothetical protein
MLTVNDIKTVAVEVINIKTGEKLEPIYEAYGFDKFQEFVAWYQANLNSDSVAFVRGIGYENGERRVLATEFVGVKELATTF